MGNVSGRGEESSEEREEYMDYAHGEEQVSYPAPLDSMVDSPPRVYPHAQGRVQPLHSNTSKVESPSSPTSSYNNSSFTIEDSNEKLPEIPPLMQQSVIDQPSSSNHSIDKPLPSVLNHLYIQKGYSGKSLAALSSTHRFRSKYVTLVLYKSVRKARK